MVLRRAAISSTLRTFGVIAQLVERLLCKQEVSGSIPLNSIFSPLKISVLYPDFFLSFRGFGSTSWIVSGGTGAPRKIAIA
jgi:hypothetical protein